MPRAGGRWWWYYVVLARARASYSNSACGHDVYPPETHTFSKTKIFFKSPSAVCLPHAMCENGVKSVSVRCIWSFGPFLRSSVLRSFGPSVLRSFGPSVLRSFSPSVLRTMPSELKYKPESQSPSSHPTAVFHSLKESPKAEEAVSELPVKFMLPALKA